MASNPTRANYSLSSKQAQKRRKHMRRRRAAKTPFNLKLWVKSSYETVMTSMFFSPALAIFGAILLGIGLTYVDRYMSHQGIDPPVVFTTTVDSARSLLSTVAGATISFAGTAFSVSLLVMQLGSSQYSPRILHTLFHDPFNRRIVAFVVGTFTYCLTVMRSVDTQQNPAEHPIVPNVSVTVAVILGVLSVLFIVAYIDHSAKTMDISQLLERVTRDTINSIDQNWEEDDMEDEGEEGSNEDSDPHEKNNPKQLDPNGTSTTSEQLNSEEMSGEMDDDEASHNEENEDNPKKPKSKKNEESQAEALDNCYVVRFRMSGWVQEIDVPALTKLVPKNGYIKLHTLAGRYGIPGTAVCSVFPKPKIDNGSKYGSTENFSSDDEDEEENRLLDHLDDSVLDTIMMGQSRTVRCDPPYGLRQLVDVILRALSPGVNDPTTAQDGIFHAAAVVTEFLQRAPPASVVETEEGGKLVFNEQHDYDSIVRLGFDEARVCASSSPMVAVYLLESLRLIRESLTAAGRPRRAPEIERQARLIEAGIQQARHVQEDYDFIIKARSDRFDPRGDWAA